MGERWGERKRRENEREIERERERGEGGKAPETMRKCHIYK